MTTASRFRVSTVVASLATLSMLTAAVSGCAVRVEDAAPAPTASIAPQATRATPAPASTGAPTSGASGSASNSAAQGPVATVDDDSMARLQRAQYTSSVSQSLTCAGGEVSIDSNADALVVSVTGDCDRVTILADGAIVLLPAVGTVEVQGDGNIVITASAKQIELTGEADANLVGWEAGTSVVRDSGVMNATTLIR